MQSSFLLLTALCFASVVLAETRVWIENNTGSKHMSLAVPAGERFCYCISKTQTALIDGRGGNNVKLFSRSDCTGNYSNGSGKVTKNAQWVNSISFGVPNKPSIWGAGTQCNWY
ncbi:hypothetical protein BGW42_004813 [Actinomortierella wolfii]|nr:hypothetical protein BGW42_004813 [Actinomortierella wolfii]